MARVEEQGTELFNNKLIKVTEYSSDRVSVSFRLDRGIVTLDLHNSGYDIVENGKVSEFNLCNAVITELFSVVNISDAETQYGSRIYCKNKELGNYLVNEAKDDNYVYVFPFLYDLERTKRFYISRLVIFNDRISSAKAVKANEMLYEIADADKPSKKFINFDLHFVDKNNKEPTPDERYDTFGDIRPVWTCNTYYVRGYLRHMQNKINKKETNYTKLTKLSQKLSKAFDGYADLDLHKFAEGDDNYCELLISKRDGKQYHLTILDKRLYLSYVGDSGETYNVAIPKNKGVGIIYRLVMGE